MGYTFNVGPECEFFLFEIDKDGKPTTKTGDEAGYFDLGPIDHGGPHPPGDLPGPGGLGV